MGDKKEESEKYFQKALDIKTDILHPTDLQVGLIYIDYARTYAALGRTLEALNSLKKAYSILLANATEGEKHQWVAKLKVTIADYQAFLHDKLKDIKPPPPTM